MRKSDALRIRKRQHCLAAVACTIYEYTTEKAQTGFPADRAPPRIRKDAVMSSTVEMQAPFADFLGIKLTHISPERVEAELAVRHELATVPDILHGGAIMALADNLGGVATVANLPKGARTATIESKTNFFAAIPVGETARAECTPLHRGRTTMVWQTRITRNDGRLCALVTQTQIVIAAEKKSCLSLAGRKDRQPASRSASRGSNRCARRHARRARPGSPPPAAARPLSVSHTARRR